MGAELHGPWSADHNWTGIITVHDARGNLVVTLEKHNVEHARRQTQVADLIASIPEFVALADIDPPLQPGHEIAFLLGNRRRILEILTKLKELTCPPTKS